MLGNLAYFLSSADFFKMNIFHTKNSRKTSVSNSLVPDQVGPDLSKVISGQQKSPRAGKELI